MRSVFRDITKLMLSAACLAANVHVPAVAQQIPISIGNTSGAITPGSNAADGNPGTSWNSGGPATQWIDIDLQQDRPVGRLRMLPEQFPAGLTHHNVYGRTSSGEWFAFGAVEGNTADSQWIEHQITQPWVSVRYLVIQTTQSPSWVAWREFQVFAPPVQSCLSSPPGSGFIQVKGEYQAGACSGYTQNPPYPNLFTYEYIADAPSNYTIYACALPPAGWTVLTQSKNSVCGYVSPWDGPNTLLIRKN